MFHCYALGSVFPTLATKQAGSDAGAFLNSPLLQF